jgi:hypothetical protein
LQGRLLHSPKIDITQIVKDAQESVSGKPVFDALFTFTNICHEERVVDLYNSARKQTQRHILSSIFGGKIISTDGRVVAKHPSCLENEEEFIFGEMTKNYLFSIGLSVRGIISPALEILLLEHRLCEADFIQLSAQSPIVPEGRALLFGKALFRGYDGDFASALHLLVPQIEHMVRTLLKLMNVKTTNLDRNGIENENGLSTLIDLPETKDILGEDLVFKFKALFCSSLGANLRNELAHGLIDEDACYSPYAIYAWWLGLKLVFRRPCKTPLFLFQSGRQSIFAPIYPR